MGKLCNNTQYFVIETKGWRREATKKGTGVGRFGPPILNPQSGMITT